MIQTMNTDWLKTLESNNSVTYNDVDCNEIPTSDVYCYKTIDVIALETTGDEELNILIDTSSWVSKPTAEETEVTKFSQELEEEW